MIFVQLTPYLLQVVTQTYKESRPEEIDTISPLANLLSKYTLNMGQYNVKKTICCGNKITQNISLVIGSLPIPESLNF